MGAQVKLVLLATTVGEQGVPPALVNMGSRSLLDAWLQALKQCTRLLPPHDKVYIVTSAQTHPHFTQLLSHPQSPLWGYPTSNLLQYPQHSGQSAPVQELQYALEEVPSLSQGYVMVASLNHFLGINLDLQRLVEHTVIRGKDTVAYTVPPPGHSLEHQALLALSGSDLNPKVTSVDAQPSGVSDGGTSAIATPVVILHPTSLTLVADVAVRVTQQAGMCQLATLLSELVAHKPVYGLQLDMSVDCSTVLGQAYCSAYVAFYQEEVEAQAKRGPAAEALDTLTASARETGTMSSGYLDVVNLLKSVPLSKQLLLKFDAVAEQRIASATGRSGISAGEARSGVRGLPVHMADTSLRRHNPKKQHPVYETTANQYGKRAPTEMDLPAGWAGSTGHFTRTFAGPYKARGLITSITTSKVHKLLDDF